jgi:hypothetical protein
MALLTRRQPFVAAGRPARAQVVVKAAAWQKATTSECLTAALPACFCLGSPASGATAGGRPASTCGDAITTLPLPRCVRRKHSKDGAAADTHCACCRPRAAESDLQAAGGKQVVELGGSKVLIVGMDDAEYALSNKCSVSLCGCGRVRVSVQCGCLVIGIWSRGAVPLW